MDDSKMENSHSFDELQIEPFDSFQYQSENPLESEFTSDLDYQMEQIEEEPATPMSSQTFNEADSQLCENIDLTDSFKTDMVFYSRDELVKWTRDVGRTIGTVIVISKSDMGGLGRVPRINFACERSGQRREGRKWLTKTNATRRKRTKRCGCPFALKGIKLPKDDQWRVTVVCGYHNHPFSQHFEGSSFAGRLSLEEKEYVADLVRGGLKPKDVLNVLKERDPHNASKLSTIYNARKHIKFTESSTKIQLQQLLKKLAENEYMERHRTHEDDDSVRDLFWAHPQSIELAKCFPNVFLMECTYKRSKYRPALLEIVGITSTNKTFSFGFAYVEAENEESYVWALECMKSVLNSGPLPSVIVTHREAPLMNAIKAVFPESRNLLCRHHISTDLVTNWKTVFSTNEAWDSFISKWNDLISSSTEAEYIEKLSSFERDLSEYSCVLSYMNETWLSEYKECFISAWTDETIHFGNTAIYRAENNDRAKLKRHLGSSQLNITTMWTAINSLLLLQHAEIQVSFMESLTTSVPHCISPLFDELKGLVSVVALDLILIELKRADSIGPDDQACCGCAIRRTHKLPCAHEIRKYKNDGKSIPISCIHPHWMKLSSVPTVTPRHELYYLPEIQLFIRKFEEASENLKLELLKKLEEIVTSV